jgi:hypothetical protein
MSQTTKNGKRSAAYRLSTTIALILAVATILEYFVAVYYPNTALLFLLAMVKAYFVLRFFMSVQRLWTPEEGH